MPHCEWLKKSPKNLIYFVLLLGLSVPITSAQASKKTLTVAGEDWPPFEFVNQSGKVTGINVDISRHIFKKLGIKANYKIDTWSRVWKWVEKGTVDVVFSTSRKEKRKPFLIYPKEDMWKSEYVFFYNQDKNRWPMIDYASAKEKKLKIAVIRGNSYNDGFWQTYPYKDGTMSFDETKKTHPLLEEGKTAEVNFKKLKKNRVNLFIIDKTIGLFLTKQLGYQKSIVPSQKVLFGKGYPMPFVKKSAYPKIKELAQRYEQELIQFKKTVTYRKILDKWLKG